MHQFYLTIIRNLHIIQNALYFFVKVKALYNLKREISKNSLLDLALN